MAVIELSRIRSPKRSKSIYKTEKHKFLYSEYTKTGKVKVKNLYKIVRIHVFVSRAVFCLQQENNKKKFELLS